MVEDHVAHSQTCRQAFVTTARVAAVYDLVELNHRFGLMRRRGDKTRGYAEAMLRTLGPPTTSELSHRAILDAAAIRDVVLMGPNARHITPSAIGVETLSLAVTFDIAVLLACKPATRG